MHHQDAQEDVPVSKGGSFFVGLLVGCTTAVVSLVFDYYLVRSLNQRSPTGIAGESLEPWLLFVILGIPIAEAFVYWKRGKYRAVIGVVVSLAIFGFLFWYLGCLIGWTCHIKISSMRY